MGLVPATFEVRTLQRNKAFPGCLRKSAPPWALTAGYKLLGQFMVLWSPNPTQKSRLQDVASNYVITVLALGAKKCCHNSQLVVVKAETALHSMTGPRAARDWWQSCWVLGSF